MIIKPSLNSDSGHNVSKFRGNNRKGIETLLKNSGKITSFRVSWSSIPP